MILPIPPYPSRSAALYPDRGVGEQPAVDRYRAPADIGRTVGGEECDHARDLIGQRRALHWQPRHDIAPARFVAELLLRQPLRIPDMFLGFHWTRIDRDHAHAVADAVAAKRAREHDQGRVGGTAGDVVGVRAVPREADDVDDDAAAPLTHGLVDLARQIDAAKHLEVPGAPPPLLVD